MWDLLRILFGPDDAGDDGDVEPAANPHYAHGQLVRALRTAMEHEDPATRARARARAKDWQDVLDGLLSGRLRVGARRPLRDVPVWATPAVVHGGFATGRLLAGGPLTDDERSFLATFALPESVEARGQLNTHLAQGEGLEVLRRLLASGRYRIDVPEAAALMAVAWLVDHDQGVAARRIVAEIAPFFDRLRFFPRPCAVPLEDRETVRLQPISFTIDRLESVPFRVERLAEREAVTVWASLFDRLVALFLETVEGPPPRLETHGDGRPIRRANGSWALTGGWPCQRYPAEWRARARAWLDDYRAARARHRLCSRPEKRGTNFAILRHALERCLIGPETLTGRDVGRVRMVLAQVLWKRGRPDEARCRDLRAAQARDALRPMKAELAAVVAKRLAALAEDDPLEAPEDVLGPITPEEAGDTVPVGQPLPPTLAAVVARSRSAPIEVLIEDGVIRSAEMLAIVLPQQTARIVAAGLPDPTLRQLVIATYHAFRRRRSLLLLRLENQVRFEELPWIREVLPLRAASDQGRDAARALFQRTVLRTLDAFPESILPNQLLKELRALAGKAELDVPIVDELAADIFMGAFTEKFVLAAQQAADLLRDSLYARYYGIDYDEVAAIDDIDRSRYGAPTSKAFLDLCRRRAGATDRGPGSVAANGTIIEQQQILTTHNLASLIVALDLRAELEPRLEDLARRCFSWICARRPHRGTLAQVKNAAYAWRQMIFFLALAPAGSTAGFPSWARSHLSEQEPDFVTRFAPALTGLEATMRGGSAAHRPFLGWTVGPH